MSSPGMNMQNEAAAAISGQRPPPQPGGNAPPNAGGGGLAEFAQAFARCEQTKQCTPQDRAILEAGLPKLIQMVKIVQQLLAVPQPGQAPQQQAPQ